MAGFLVLALFFVLPSKWAFADAKIEKKEMYGSNPTSYSLSIAITNTITSKDVDDVKNDVEII